jgi:autotransporter translocation and assembly factor TamB
VRLVRRTLRLAAWIALTIVTAAASLVLIVLIAARTGPGRERLRRLIVSQARARLDGELRIGRVGGDLTRGLWLEDVELDDPEGQPAVRARRVALRYDLPSLMRRLVRIDDVRLDGAWVRARTLRDGRLNLNALAKPSPAPPGRAWDVRVRSARGDVEVRFEPPPHARTPPLSARVELDGSFASVADQMDAVLRRVSIVSLAPARATVDVTGAVHADARVPELRDVVVSARSDGAELERVLPRLPLRGTWRARLTASGPLGAMQVALAVEPPRGHIDAAASLGLRPRSGVEWRARARVRDVDPGAAIAGAPHGLVELDAAAQGANARGTVELERFIADAGGAHARAHGRATLGATLSGDASVDVEARDLSRLATLGAPALSGTLALHAHVARTPGPGPHTLADVDLHGARLGVAAARLGRVDAHVHARDLDGRALVQASDVQAADLRLRTLSVAASGDPHALAVELEARGPHGDLVVLRAHGVPLRGAGALGADATIDRLLIALRGQKWEASRPGHVRFSGGQANGALALESGAQTLALDGRYGPAGALAAHVTGRALDLARLVQLARRARRLPRTSIDLDARLSGTRAAPIADVTLAGASEADASLRLDRVTAHARAHWAQKRVQGELALASAGQRLNARADLPTDAAAWAGARPIRVELDGDHVSLERLAPLLPPKLATLRGRARLQARVWGTTRKPELEAALDLAEWQLSARERNRATVNVRYAGARLDGTLDATFATARGIVHGGTAPGGRVEAHVAAAIDLARSSVRRRLAERLEHQTPIDASVALHGVELDALPLGELGVRAPLDAGTLDGRVQLSGTLHAPVVRGELDARRLAVHGVEPLFGARARIDYGERRARVELDGTLRDAPILHARAETDLDFQRVIDGQPWRNAPLRVDATIPPYDLAREKPRTTHLGGRVEGHAELRGTLARPTGHGELRATALELGVMRWPRAIASAEFDGARVTGAVTADQASSGSLRVNADVPLAADRPLTVALAAHGLELAAERLGSVRTLKARLDAELSIAGTRAQPSVNGFVRLGSGRVGFVSQSRIYRDVALDVAIGGGVVELKRLAVSLGGGTLTAQGRSRLTGFLPATIDLTAQANKLPLSQGAVGMFVDADVEVHGARVNGVMSGQATIKSATTHLPKLATGKKLQSTAPLTDVVFVDEAARRERDAKARAATAGAQADLKAHIPGPFRVRSPELMTDLKGDLDVELVGPVARVSGDVETTWGWVSLLNRRWEIDHARASFDGNPDPNPALDVRVTRDVGQATILIDVHGTARKPELALSSEPPIYDQSQIVGIIVSGDPGAQRISARSSDAQIVGAISGLVVNKIKDQIAPGLPIDVLRVNTGGDDLGGLGQTRVEVGKFVTDKLYLSYVHQFGTPTGTRRVNSNQAQMEYRFKRRFALDTMFGDAGQGAIDLFWSLRY